MALYRPSVPYWTLSMTHSSTTGPSVNTNATRYFGVPTSLDNSVTSTTTRGFGFPASGTVIGAVSTLYTGTQAAGTKTGTAALGLYARGAASNSSLNLEHDYTQAINVIRSSGLSIPVSTSETYAIQVFLPAYATTSPSAYVHHVTLFIR